MNFVLFLTVLLKICTNIEFEIYEVTTIRFVTLFPARRTERDCYKSTRRHLLSELGADHKYPSAYLIIPAKVREYVLSVCDHDN